MLDADTSSVTFDQIKSSAKAIGLQFNIGKNKNQDRVTAFSFSSEILEKESLGKFPNTKSFNNHIDNMGIDDTEKNMPFALDAVHAHFQEKGRDVTKVIVLLSDGHVDMNSWDSSLERLCSSISGQTDFSEEAIQACFLEQVKHVVDDGGIKIVYVPVGDQPFVPEADTDELADYLKIPSDLSSPEGIAKGVADLVCDVTAGEAAENGVDIIFVVDATYTGSAKEDYAISFLNDFLSENVFDTVPAGSVRFGSVVYSNVIVDEQTILDEDGDPRFETGTKDFMDHLESVIRSSQNQGKNGNLETNTPLALKTAQNMIVATREADTAAGRNDRLTYVVHVGDNKPFVRFADHEKIPSDCDGYSDQSRYPQEVVRTCTSKYAQAIQDTPATFIAARVGNRQANDLYNDVEPKVQEFSGKDVQGLDLTNCIMTAECSTVPPDEPAPSPLEEFCTEIGGLYAGGLACCSESCGTCGGGGCSSRPGGYSACCQSGVESSDRICSDLVGPPCRMNAPTSAPTSAPTFLSVRVTLPGSDRVLSLCEVELLDQDMNPLPLFEAQQSSTAYGGDAPRAIDGVSDTTWAGDSCTHTEPENDPFWEALTSVDVQTIATVRLTNRVEACYEGPCEARLAGVEVTLGGTPFFNVQIVPSFPTDGTTLEEVCTDIGGLYAGGFACCASSCGTCGGGGCSGRPGGTYACCQTAIEPSSRICSDLVGPPCRMEPIEAP